MKAHLTLASLVLFLAACNQQSQPPAAGDYAERMAREHGNDRPAPSPAAQGGQAMAIRSQVVTYGSVGGQEVHGYLAYPAAAEGGLPGVLVFHEWWGLNDNIKSMADQLAAQGYVALAADFYGGAVATAPDAAKALLNQALGRRQDLAENMRQAHAFLTNEVKATRIGTIGWCFGGMMSLEAALLLSDRVDAAVIYYGHVGHTPAAELKKLEAPLLGHFGGADTGIPVDSVRQFEAALKQLGKPAEIHVYEGAAHAFANPSGGNYKADAAADAWQKSLGFLARHLKQG